jgi:hypothetical protein
MNRRFPQHLSQMALLALLVLCALDTGAKATVLAPDFVSSRLELMKNPAEAINKISKKMELAQRRRDRRGGKKPRFRRPPQGSFQMQSPPEEVLERRRLRRLRNQQQRNRDQDNARDAVRSGAALPLSSIIQGVQASCPGRFLGARLIRRGDQLAYRLNILRPSGKRVTMFVDAANGNVVRGRCR